MTGGDTCAVALCAVLLACGAARAAPPLEVPASMTFGPDGETLAWAAPAGGADTYDVYRGSSPATYDHQCRVVGTAALQATMTEAPPPDGLFYFLVGAVNADGAGPLGADSNGTPIPNPTPCLDLDGDSVPDNTDNCPGAFNPAQDDQDANGAGDRCDPNTYDFESDTVGQRPAGMTRSGGPVPFSVQDLGGDLGVSYSAAGDDVTDRFDTLLAGMTRQNATVYLDLEDTAASCAVELWADGAASLLAGTAVVLEVASGGELTFHSRLNDAATSIVGPVIPANGRLRLRLVKGAGDTSRLHVDSWDGSAFVSDFTVFDLADDRRHRGLAAALSSRGGGARGVKRVTVVHEIPPGALTLRQDPSWSSDWKLFQRDADDRASVPLKFYYRHEAGAVRAQARVALASTTSALPGHDYSDHELSLPASAGAAADLLVANVPAGGNYDVHLRLLRDSDDAVLGEQTLAQIAVGDVFVAAGQSNMSGRGGFSGGEQRVDPIHVYHNDGLWKRAEEPMDDKLDQVDNVSYDHNVGHSLMLRFAKEVEAAVGVPVAIVPGPLGGSTLWNHWQPDASDRENRGTLYGSLLHRTRLQGYTTPPRGFLWYQGESDLGRGVTLYKTDLQDFIAEVRADYEDPDLPFFVAQLATYAGQPFPALLAIQEAQRQVAAEDPHTALVTTVDQPRGDQVHLLQQGLREVGVRFAEAARKLVYGEASTPLLELVEARRTIGGTEIELVYDGDLVGGAPALFTVADTAGTPGVTQATVSGTIVTLSLDRPLQGDATVSYGFSSAWTDAWIEDLQGVPVALFFEVPVAP